MRASWTRRPSSGSGCSGARRRLGGSPAPARAAALRDRGTTPLRLEHEAALDLRSDAMYQASANLAGLSAKPPVRSRPRAKTPPVGRRLAQGCSVASSSVVKLSSGMVLS